MKTDLEFKLDQEVKIKWVEALRSGKYNQGTRGLRSDLNGDRYCCLGVLCDLVDPDGWKMVEGAVHTYAHRGRSGYPSADIQDQVKLKHEAMKELAHFNDTGQDFNFIADHIERWL